MKITVIDNLKIKEGQKRLNQAIKKGIKDVVRDIASDAIKGSPIAKIGGGTNRRSIRFEVGLGGEVAKEELSGAVYSTSGYGGFLETGTVKMAARPYFKPALDKNIKNLPKEIKADLGRF